MYLCVFSVQCGYLLRIPYLRIDQLQAEAISRITRNLRWQFTHNHWSWLEISHKEPKVAHIYIYYIMQVRPRIHSFKVEVTDSQNDNSMAILCPVLSEALPFTAKIRSEMLEIRNAHAFICLCHPGSSCGSSLFVTTLPFLQQTFWQAHCTNHSASRPEDT